MICVTALTKTCNACPAQWEGATDDGRPVYARYRYGRLYVTVGDPGGRPVYFPEQGRTVFDATPGGCLDGDMDLRTLRDLTRGAVAWPELDYDPDTLD